MTTRSTPLRGRVPGETTMGSLLRPLGKRPVEGTIIQGAALQREQHCESFSFSTRSLPVPVNLHSSSPTVAESRQHWLAQQRLRPETIRQTTTVTYRRRLRSLGQVVVLRAEKKRSGVRQSAFQATELRVSPRRCRSASSRCPHLPDPRPIAPDW